MNKSSDKAPVMESPRSCGSPSPPSEPPRTPAPAPEDGRPPTPHSPVTSPNTPRPLSSMTTQTIAVPENQQDIEADDVGLCKQTPLSQTFLIEAQDATLVGTADDEEASLANEDDM